MLENKLMRKRIKKLLINEHFLIVGRGAEKMLYVADQQSDWLILFEF